MLAVTAAALALLWNPVGFAAENPSPRAQIQQQETLLAELESAHGGLHTDVVAQLLTLIGLLRDESEFERAAEARDRLFAVMDANLEHQGADWIPALREMIASRAGAGETDGVGELLRQLRILNAAKGDWPELVHTVELEAHWLMTGGAGKIHGERIENFFRAQEILTKRFGYLVDELFEETDPRIIPWVYQMGRKRQLLFDLIQFDFRHEGLILDELIGRSPLASGVEVGIGLSNPGSWIGEQYAAAGDLEAQAMAKLYEADFMMSKSRSSAFELYEESWKMLREAGVPEERIARYFSQPQLIPADRFHPRLEAAIAEREAALAAWRPATPGAAHVETYTAWSDTSPIVAMPVSDHVFWESPTRYHRGVLRFDIGRTGRVSGLDVLEFEPENREVQRDLRKAFQAKRFRPAIAEGRGQRLRDVRMQVLIPRRVD